jgi:inorganic triphosphatase YgiF
MTDAEAMPGAVERELKLVPRDAGLLDQLEVVDRLGEFAVQRRRRERQRNSFFDTASRALAAARIGFRRRIVDGERLAAWTLKADGQRSQGVAIRTEIELHLDPDMPPIMALSALRQAARQRGAVALSEALGEALATGGLPLAQPVLETETERAVADLTASAQGWEIELALDHVRMPGHDYAEVEIEAELKRGDLAALTAIRQAIEALGTVRESEGTKLSRALAHERQCQCP